MVRELKVSSHMICWWHDCFSSQVKRKRSFMCHHTKTCDSIICHCHFRLCIAVCRSNCVVEFVWVSARGEMAPKRVFLSEETVVSKEEVSPLCQEIAAQLQCWKMGDWKHTHTHAHTHSHAHTQISPPVTQLRSIVPLMLGCVGMMVGCLGLGTGLHGPWDPWGSGALWSLLQPYMQSTVL